MLILKEARHILHDCTDAPCKHVHACLKKGSLFLEMLESLKSPVTEGHSNIPSLSCRSLQLCGVSPKGSMCGGDLAAQLLSRSRWGFNCSLHCNFLQELPACVIKEGCSFTSDMKPLMSHCSASMAEIPAAW